MIQSILDNDLYKFTMQQAVHRLYPRAQAEYEFTNRGATAFPQGFAQRVKQEIEKMAGLSLSQDQKAYLKNTCSFLTPTYLDYLESYTYNPDEVTLGQEKEIFFLNIKGPWQIPIPQRCFYPLLTHALPDILTACARIPGTPLPFSKK